MGSDRIGAGPQRGHQETESPPAARHQPPVDAVSRLAQAVGNRSFAQLARRGGGLLPSGYVHPDLQTAIDLTRGTGRPLDSSTRERVAGVLGDPLHDVKIYTDSTAAALARAADARAFTTGSDIYFGAGEYRPGDATGNRLLAHELTHVVQQRGAPRSGRMVVSQPGDAQELEAEVVARELFD